MPATTVDDVIKELEGIIWEAENAEYFSISDLKPVVDSLKAIDWAQKPSWGRGICAWFLIPLFVVLLPVSYLYSFVFERK